MRHVQGSYRVEECNLFFENKKGILFTIADNIADNPNNDPQSDNSNFGK